MNLKKKKKQLSFLGFSFIIYPTLNNWYPNKKTSNSVENKNNSFWFHIDFLLKYKCMEEKDKIIASLREQLRKALQKNSAQEQEITLLNYELERAKMKPSKQRSLNYL